MQKLHYFSFLETPSVFFGMTRGHDGVSKKSKPNLVSFLDTNTAKGGINVFGFVFEKTASFSPAPQLSNSLRGINKSKNKSCETFLFLNPRIIQRQTKGVRTSFFSFSFFFSLFFCFYFVSLCMVFFFLI